MPRPKWVVVDGVHRLIGDFDGGQKLITGTLKWGAILGAVTLEIGGTRPP